MSNTGPATATRRWSLLLGPNGKVSFVAVLVTFLFSVPNYLKQLTRGLTLATVGGVPSILLEK